MDGLKRFEPQVVELAAALRARGWRLAAAESCTGGLIAAACTMVAGASDWFERGFVTYSNPAKTAMLGVPASLIEAHGAVSAEVACAMALGALQRAPVELAVAVTGIAGPAGAVPGKPVGTVWLAWATTSAAAASGTGTDTDTGTGSRIEVERLHLHGDRSAIRAAAVRLALQRLLQAASA